MSTTETTNEETTAEIRHDCEVGTCMTMSAYVRKDMNGVKHYGCAPHGKQLEDLVREINKGLGGGDVGRPALP